MLSRLSTAASTLSSMSSSPAQRIQSSILTASSMNWTERNSTDSRKSRARNAATRRWLRRNSALRWPTRVLSGMGMKEKVPLISWEIRRMRISFFRECDGGPDSHYTHNLFPLWFLHPPCSPRVRTELAAEGRLAMDTTIYRRGGYSDPARNYKTKSSKVLAHT